MVEKNLLVGIQDMGAAGLTCSSAEMAAKGNAGMVLDLDRVPQREPAMTPYEMMLSESQERMLLVVEKGREEEVRRICDEWGLLSAVVGRVTGDGRLRLLHKGEKVADIPGSNPDGGSGMSSGKGWSPVITGNMPPLSRKRSWSISTPVRRC